MTTIPRPINRTTDVLVVGAGPAGLSLAIDLARRGLDVQIIDTLAESTSESRAVVVHARTLDHLEALGALDGVLDRGVVVTGMEMHAAGRTESSVQFEHMNAEHPYAVSLVQPETEGVLARRLRELGVTVRRSTTLTAAISTEDEVLATVVDANGDAQIVRAQFLVGADGARSTVRHVLNERLGGSFLGEDILLGDIEGVHCYERSHLHAFIAAGPSSGLLFPLRQDRLRVVIQLPDGTDPELEPTIDWLQQLMDERAIAVRITDVHRLTRVSHEHGQVASYRRGRILLVGDAAHVHSPAGALGMNTGIQDAVNLGWKLTHVLRTGGETGSSTAITTNVIPSVSTSSPWPPTSRGSPPSTTRSRSASAPLPCVSASASHRWPTDSPRRSSSRASATGTAPSWPAPVVNCAREISSGCPTRLSPRPLLGRPITS